jgi:two-component system CheB/CheR fusion protein
MGDHLLCFAANLGVFMSSDGKTYIVGIGASAGGLEAISQLIAHLKPEIPCAYVVLQHLSPSYRSMMVEILARETTLAVREAGQGDLPQAGTLYVVPANTNALLRDGRLQLLPAQPEVVPKPSINQFFFSLAAERGESAVGIVLSGTGSDGAAGLRAIQAAGGYTLVQSPESAKYDGMPRAAIEAGLADHILTPEEIAAHLPRLLELPAQPAESVPPDLLDQLLGRLRDKLQFDFSGYKVSTLMRRIRRREVATGNSDLDAYLKWVETNPGELDLLARDILISVTAFFRDREAFEALKRIVANICTRKSPGGEIRVWVAGCASGEEAYSIAVLFAEALGERLAQYRVQIFATDIDDEALGVARRGAYPAASMSEVPADLLQRHFRLVNNAYEAGKQLRDMIVFARHNLVSEPPFLRLDLISCRNVLIYFDAPLQAKVLQTFHFGLVKEGELFLGRSESVSQAEQYFTVVDRRERLFRKSGESPILPNATATVINRLPVQRRESRFSTLLGGVARHFGLTAVLCDMEGNILHSAGQVERFLQFPEGAARLGIAEVVATPLRGELLTLMHRFRKARKPLRGRRRRVGEGVVRLSIEPAEDAGTELAIVLFVPETAGKIEEPPATTESLGLEHELLATREHMQTLVEEMATANEEMQALNEEAQASNEELQATNEEMEAANEELQATNQELVSLNGELNAKTIELSQLTEEYSHLYDALQFPILVFDRNLQLIRFNSPAGRRFDLRPTALQQSVDRLRLPAALAGLERQLGQALAHGEREEDGAAMDGRDFRISVTPGFDKEGKVVTLVAALVDVTEIVRTQAELNQSQSRLSALMDKTTVIFAMKDRQGNYLFANRRFLDFFAVDSAAYMGKNDYALFPPPLAHVLASLDLTVLRRRESAVETLVVDTSSGPHWLRATHQLLLDEAGEPNAFIFEADDVTAERRGEEQMRITARVFDQAGEAIVVTDAAGIIQTVNTAFTLITGYSNEEAVGRSTTMLKSGRQSKEFYQEMWRALDGPGYWQGEIWNRRKNGEIYPEWLTINRVDDDRGDIEHFVAVFSDISQIKESQRKVEYLATHDTLTGLPNRALFNDRLHHALAQARRQRTRLALLFIDLDNFKTINDTLGHNIGDELLTQAAGRLRQVVRDVDTIARMGGDEFTALLSDADEEAVELVAQRLIDELSASFKISGHTLFVSASVGVAFYPDDGSDSASLIKAADTAMYRAKDQGRNRVEYFKPDLHVKLLKRATLDSALREALRADRLRLVYQPKFDLRGNDGAMVGAEALLRWFDPSLGEVSPAEFIPVAESSGLILEVTRAVERLLIEQIKRWTEQGLNPPPVAFNLSPKVIREPNYAAALIGAIASAGLPTDRIQVEITEGALLENSTRVADNLNALDAAGLKVAIDDFGTGYSSLNYLKRLPIHELKIDKSFVDGLGADKEDEAIARAVLALAAALGFNTVAEGVETERQLEWLRRHDCDIAQGYLLSRPCEVAAFEQLLVGRESGGEIS